MAWSESEYQALLANQATAAINELRQSFQAADLCEQEKIAQRKLAGRTARRHGVNFERQVDLQCAQYVKQGRLAHVIQQMPPMRPIYEKKRLLFAPTGPGPCDRVFVLPSGLFGIFDCKSSDKLKQFTWSKDQTHQLAELRAIRSATQGRSPAFALVYWRDEDRVCVHLIEHIEDRTVYRSSGSPIDGVDWLPFIERAWCI